MQISFGVAVRAMAYRSLIEPLTPDMVARELGLTLGYVGFLIRNRALVSDPEGGVSGARLADFIESSHRSRQAVG
jgi:hypothetical protein